MDAIVVYHSVYHFNIASLTQTLKAIVSYLKKDGICVISVMDDADKFAQRYLKLSPQYRLSGSVEDALKEMGDAVECRKEVVSDDYTMRYDDFLKFLEWLFIQDCLNQNYFANGASEEQLNEVRKECQQYIETECVRTEQVDESGNKQAVYTTPLPGFHFVITKK